MSNNPVRITRILVHCVPNQEAIALEMRDSIGDFVGRPAMNTSDTQPPASLVSRIPYESSPLMVRPLAIIRGGHTERWYEIVNKNAQEEQFRLVCHNSITVAQMLRCHWGDTHAQIPKLVSKGIPFKTLHSKPAEMDIPADGNIYYMHPSTTYGNGHSLGLGIRDVGFKPSSGDIRQYEQMTLRVATQPHGRAGLKLGGIVWRILYDILHMEENYIGPSPYGSYEIMNIEGYPFFDDVLSPQEQDILCGVYRVAACKIIVFFSHTRQITNDYGYQLAIQATFQTHPYGRSKIHG